MLDVRERDDGVTIAARVRPRSRPGLELTEAGLAIRVAAPPEKGRATEEARRSLAEALQVAPSAVSLLRGATARRKLFAAEGIGAAAARERLLAATRR